MKLKVGFTHGTSNILRLMKRFQVKRSEADDHLSCTHKKPMTALENELSDDLKDASVELADECVMELTRYQQLRDRLLGKDKTKKCSNCNQCGSCS